MEELEVPTEGLQEDIHHRAHESEQSWTMGVALSSAIIAALAAIAALLGGHHSNEAMMDQIRASDQWGYFQAKGIKGTVLATKIQLLEAMNKPINADDRKKMLEYRNDQEGIEQIAHEREVSAHEHLELHSTLAKAVTLFQVAIAISAISVLTRRRRFWIVSLGFGFLGLFFLISGLR